MGSALYCTWSLNWYIWCILSHSLILTGLYDQSYRADFESEGTPDLNKDVYLQDIHSVSSLCKAYFRELPNPLLTYQLYDKFAVSIITILTDYLDSQSK